jgi:exonuclease SbcC
LFDGKAIADVRAVMKEKVVNTTKSLQQATAFQQENTTRLEELEKNLVRLQTSLENARQGEEKAIEVRDIALHDRKLELSEVFSLLSFSAEKRNELAKNLEELTDSQTKSAALLADRKLHLEMLVKQVQPKKSKEQIQELLHEIEAQGAMLMIDLGKNRSRLELDDEALKNRRKLSGKIEKIEENHALWAVINEAIGSKNGTKFRSFVQGVTLDHLVVLANEQLRNINPRYKIERNTIAGLGLQVLDVEMGGEIRSVRSLSGGERFLVSLALALGLSQLDGRSSFVDTLMIDEGFGALDARSLDIVIEALESLQSQGRKVGVISHIEALTDRIPVQINVEKQGNGRSQVRVVDHGFSGGV